MNAKNFIEYALREGLSEAQILVSKSSSLKIQIYHGEIEGYGVSDSQSIIAIGYCNGKFGIGISQKLDKDAFPFLVNAIKESASLNEKTDNVGIFEGSLKYHKKNVYSKALEAMPVTDKIALLKSIEARLWKADPLISDVAGVHYSESTSSTELYNSHGLKLKQKGNYATIYAEVVAKKGEEVKTGLDFFLGNDLSSLDADAFIKRAALDAVSKLGGTTCKSGKYRTVLKRSVFAELLSFFLDSLSAEEVEKHSSLVEGRLHTKIASPKITISERPLTPNVFCQYFDDEGVAKENRILVNKGILETYLYNRETAARQGVATTANGVITGSKIGIGYSNVFVKPGKKDFDSLIEEVHDGVYITDVTGVAQGMNSQSGNFSCQAQGFMIKNGRIAEPLSLITLSGNLLAMLEGVRGLDNCLELDPSSISVPDVYIKAMNIGGGK